MRILNYHFLHNLHKLKFHTFPNFFDKMKKCGKFWNPISYISYLMSIFPQCAQWFLESWNVICVTWRTSPSGKRTLMRQNRYFLLSFISSLSLMALVRSIVSRSANSDLKRREQKNRHQLPHASSIQRRRWQNSVWKSQKKSHSVATFTFWEGKSWLKCQIGQFAEFFENLKLAVK